jgi:hypothetical protein
MARYRGCFEGKWQGDFEDREAALEWAREVGNTGRLAYVSAVRWFWTRLVAVFPENRVAEGMKLWNRRAFSGDRWGVKSPTAGDCRVREAIARANATPATRLNFGDQRLIPSR